MRLSIIIPAHNEATYLEACLEAFVAQTRTPDELILVDDHSTDATFAIASAYAQKYSWIKGVQRQSSEEHRPGKKVVDAFTFGLHYITDYDLIGKFDADILLPPTYFETVLCHFQTHQDLGMCSGLLYVQQGSKWVYEAIANMQHIRGPVKLYRKACFAAIGGLRPGVGWDTVDVLLAHYHGFNTLTDPTLKVQHLRPTGQGYSAKTYGAKGEALYKMRYGFLLTKITALKMAWQAQSLPLYVQVLLGHLKAVIRKPPRFVTKEEGRFIRAYRWKGVWSNLV